jgi:mono/diheme cytochrome c family protein
MTRFKPTFWPGAFLGLLSFSSVADTEPVYSVECAEDAATAEQCTVDKQTYIGWRTYNSSCSHCHGQDGLGGSFAPSLVAGNAAVRNYADFLRVTTDGSEGPTGVMPGFKDNPNINDKLAAVYQYLKARSDKLLPQGRPKR